MSDFSRQTTLRGRREEAQTRITSSSISSSSSSSSSSSVRRRSNNYSTFPWVLSVTLLCFVVYQQSLLVSQQITFFPNQSAIDGRPRPGDYRKSLLSNTASTSELISTGSASHRAGTEELVGSKRKIPLFQKLLDELINETRQRLERGKERPCHVAKCVFADIVPSLPLTPPAHIISAGWDKKHMISPKLLYGEKRMESETAKTSLTSKTQSTSPSPPCVFYSIGIGPESGFESQMASFGCDVHAFDCTVERTAEQVTDKNFTFHQLCIGKQKQEQSPPTSKSTHRNEDGDTSKADGDENAGIADTDYGKTFKENNRQLQFEPFLDVVRRLGHQRLDGLKFDAEGAEWELVDEILQVPQLSSSSRTIVSSTSNAAEAIATSPSPLLPTQIMFELHTEGANRKFVPPSLVSGKGKRQVNEMILKLMDAGYVVQFKEVNPADMRCAEISLVLLDKV